MFSLVLAWFKRLNGISKVFVLIVFFLLLSLSIQSARLARSEYLRLKEIENKYKEASEKVEASEEEEAEIINRGEVFTKKTVSKNKSINQKLKDDEKYINDSSISDDEIRSFISKHKER